MDFRILVPLQVFENGRVLPVGSPKERALLTSLLLGANRVVASDRLIEMLWGAAPPDTARATLQTYVLRLRRALQPARDQGRRRSSPGHPGMSCRSGPTSSPPSKRRTKPWLDGC
jgi:DNA-binding SARP family transcriptional activator